MHWIERAILLMAMVMFFGPAFLLFFSLWKKRGTIEIICEDGIRREMIFKPCCLQNISDVLDVYKGRKKVEDVRPHPGPCDILKGYCDKGLR